MSSEIAIQVENLSKCYPIYEQPRDRLTQFVLPRLQRLAGLQPHQYFREFWALRDVSLQVRKGETVGIIGRNGSGKSTLLQLICGTLNPTAGTIRTTGRIAALLELGSGFNPEFTGRENVYMNAAVLGLASDEIDARFADIAAFADIGEFIERPVKTYSSGMVVRLAFAVAINSSPDILVIDEALAVGDELFQRKCFSRIGAIRAAGATILFVSHSGSQVVELCDRAVLLDTGERLSVGDPKQVVGSYQQLLYAPSEKREKIRSQILAADSAEPRNLQSEISNDSDPGIVKPTADEFLDPGLISTSSIYYPSRGARIENPTIVGRSGNPVNNLVQRSIYRYTYSVIFEEAAENVLFGMLIKTVSGVELGGATSSHSIQSATSLVHKGTRRKVEFEFQCNLNPGVYFLNAGVYGRLGSEEVFLHRVLDACAFRVLPVHKGTATGFVDFNCRFTIDHAESSA